MTNVRRPIHLQLKPRSVTLSSTCSPKALSPTLDTLPSQILPHLFVGNLEQTNKEIVNRLNISYILSLGLLPLISTTTSPTVTTTTTTTQTLLPSQNSSKDFKISLRSSNNSHLNHHNSNYSSVENKIFKANRSVQCKCINIADDNETVLSKFFDEAHQFIDEARRKKCNILVHCSAGISRSPTIAIAYLMKVNSLSLEDAYDLVRRCRPQTGPNISFMGQLMQYEKSLEERRGTCR